MQQVLKSYNTMKSSQGTQKVVSKYLAIYEEKESLIERAVAIGAISNSDFLEIKGIRNEALSKISKARLLESQSKSNLRKDLSNFYSPAIKEIQKKILKVDFKTFNKKENVSRKLKIQAEKLEIEITIKKQSLKPISKLSASITSPQERDKDKTLFAGYGRVSD